MWPIKLISPFGVTLCGNYGNVQGLRRRHVFLSADLLYLLRRIDKVGFDLFSGDFYSYFLFLVVVIPTSILLITSRFVILSFFLFRFACEKYMSGARSNEEFVHLTNYSLNKYSKAFVR